MQLAWMWFGRPAGRHPQKKKLRTELSRNVFAEKHPEPEKSGAEEEEPWHYLHDKEPARPLKVTCSYVQPWNPCSVPQGTPASTRGWIWVWRARRVG